MRAIVVDHPGGPEVLVCRDVAMPQVRPGWSLVRVRGAGVNRSEVFTRQGLSPSVVFPRVLGIECVGEVAQSTSDDLSVGQTVVSVMGEMGRAFDGGYAEYALLPNEQIYPINTHLTWEELAAVPETFATAYGSLRQLKIEGRQRVLVRGASSGVGVAFAKLARAIFPEAALVGSTRSLTKADALRALGFDAVVEDRDNRLGECEPMDRILDLIGPAALKDSFAHLVPGGIVCSTGQLGGQWTMEGFDPITDTRGGYLAGFHSNDVDAAMLQEVITLIEVHGIDVRPQQVFPLEQAAQAHEFLEDSRGYGKVVLVPWAFWPADHGANPKDRGAMTQRRRA